MSNVYGVFNTHIQADSAVTSLLDSGFKSDEISLLVTDKGKDAIFRDVNKDNDKVTGGAVAGGALAALVGGLAIASNVVLPGVGLMAVGPLAAIIGGAGAAAAAGSLTGALVGAGIDKAVVSRFEDELKAGKAIVVVNTDNEKEEAKARAILSVGTINTKVA